MPRRHPRLGAVQCPLRVYTSGMDTDPVYDTEDLRDDGEQWDDEERDRG